MSIRDELFLGGEDGDMMICKIIVIVKLGRVISPLLKGDVLFFQAPTYRVLSVPC